MEETARIVAQIRRRWPRVRILLRGDSGFARETLMAWCDPATTLTPAPGAGVPHSKPIKRLVRPGLGFGSLPTARRTLAGYEAMAMIRKGQVHNIGGHDIQAQTVFVASLFQMAA